MEKGPIMTYSRIFVAYSGPNGIFAKLPTISSKMHVCIEYIVYVFSIDDICNILNDQISNINDSCFDNLSNTWVKLRMHCICLTTEYMLCVF